MGFSPYAPEYLSRKEAKTIGVVYDLLDQLAPLILADQGTGKMVGIRAPARFDGRVDLDTQHFTLGAYTFAVHFREPAPISIGAKTEIPMPGAHGGLIIQLEPDEFLIAGSGMIVDFGPHGPGAPIVGIESVQEGKFVNGAWVRGRTLNGDDTNQGRYLRIPAGTFSLRRVRLYRYR
jgi:hypothetical protein